MALPLVDALKKTYPDAEIHALIRKPFSEIFVNDSRFDEVIAFDLPKTLFEKAFPKHLHKLIKTHNYDLAILCTRSLSSALPFSLAGIKTKIGAKRFCDKLLLTHTISFNKSLHQRSQYLQLLEPLGIKPTKLHGILSKNPLSLSFLKIPDRFVILHPGASYGSAKTWPLEHFEKLADFLIQHCHVQVVFCGDNKQKKPSINHDKVIDLTGKTSLNELKTLFENACLVVCNDSGPMHLADCLETPLICLFGPTDPSKTGPINPSALVLQNKVPCGPCFKRTCPIDHVCMKSLSPEKVFEKARAILETYGTS